MSETLTVPIAVGTRLAYVQPVLEVIKTDEVAFEVRDQFGWQFAIPYDSLDHYEVMPSAEQCEVKEAAYEDWHERDLRREALAQAIALAKGSTVIGTDIIQNAEKFYTYLKGTQA